MCKGLPTLLSLCTLGRLVVAAVVGLGTAIVGGCDGDEAPACVSGSSRSCSGDTGCRGNQVCSGDPANWSSCDCDPGPPPDGNNTRDAGAHKPGLGASCHDDKACPKGALCSTSLAGRFFAGTTVAGTCVADCSHDTATCDAFENAVCVHTARAAEQATEEDAGLEIDAGVDTSAAFCFERCRLSGSADGKCHELEEVACEPLGAKDTGFCRPVCSVDSQCPHGACDRRSGACVDRQPRTDTTFGTPCEIDRSDCDGLCIDVNEKQSLCTHRCVFGAPGSCVDPATEGRRGGCVVVTPGGGIGDVGYCMPLCECADNCPDKTSVCDPFKDTTLEKTFGTAGVCTDKDIALNEPLECK